MLVPVTKNCVHTVLAQTYSLVSLYGPPSSLSQMFSSFIQFFSQFRNSQTTSKVSTEWKLSTIKQRFTLPEALVFYMAKNPPSPEVYHKLIRCCKYFWLKNPVIALKDLYRHRHGKYWKTIKINGFEVNQTFKVKNLNEKLWIYHQVSIYNEKNQFLASSLAPRIIFRCDLTSLGLGCQSLSFDEFQKVTSSFSFKSLFLKKTMIKNSDGTVVAIEKIIQSLPNLRTFYYINVSSEDRQQTITSETAANLIVIPHFPKIKNFTMEKIPESFDIEAFFATPKVRTFSIV